MSDPSSFSVDVIGLGAGGHAKVVIDLLQVMGGYRLVGLLDRRRELWGSSLMGVPVLGDDDLLSQMYADGICHAFIGVGVGRTTAARRRLFEKVRQGNFDVVRAIHPSSVVSSSATIGAGPTIMAAAVINADARLGENVLVNTGAIVEHDCVICDHVHVATGARLAGGVYVGRGAHIGLGVSVRQAIRVGACSVVGAGAVVVSDVPDQVVVAGVPARIIGTVEG